MHVQILSSAMEMDGPRNVQKINKIKLNNFICLARICRRRSFSFSFIHSFAHSYRNSFAICSCLLKHVRFDFVFIFWLREIPAILFIYAKNFCFECKLSASQWQNISSKSVHLCQQIEWKKLVGPDINNAHKLLHLLAASDGQ